MSPLGPRLTLTQNAGCLLRENELTKLRQAAEPNLVRMKHEMAGPDAQKASLIPS
jgi:hypothetical protein